MRLTAPRILNAPVRCGFSAFSSTSRPVRRDSVSDGYTGVTRAIPAMRSRAAAMSASVGAVRINFEDLFHVLAHRRQGIDLPAADRVEEPLQLRVAGHRHL